MILTGRLTLEAVSYTHLEAFKNFKLDDYMPSMHKHEPEESSSVPEQEHVVEAGNLFPVLDEPETSEGDVYKRQVYG